MAASTNNVSSRADRFERNREKTTKLISYILSGSYESGATEGEKRVIRRLAKNYSYDKSSK